jgi:hypothetical protein
MHGYGGHPVSDLTSLVTGLIAGMLMCPEARWGATNVGAVADPS